MMSIRKLGITASAVAIGGAGLAIVLNAEFSDAETGQDVIGDVAATAGMQTITEGAAAS